MRNFLSMIAIISSLVTASYADEYIGTYYARLGKADHYNSRGVRLRSVAAIIRQDRFNFHIRHIRDEEDTYDSFFDSKSNRATLERMIRSGYISWSAREEIIDDYPLIKVVVYRRHVNIYLANREGPRSVIR